MGFWDRIFGLEPRTLEEAIEFLYKHMTEDERKAFARPGSPNAHHHSFGQQLRNEWGLWQDSPLARHFKMVYELGHPDDMSGMVLTGLFAKIIAVPFDPEVESKYYHSFWLNQFIDPLTQKRIVF